MTDPILAAIIAAISGVIVAIIPIVLNKKKKKKTDATEKIKKVYSNAQLIYDINQDLSFSTSWIKYRTSGNYSISPVQDDGNGFKLQTNDSTKVGINKSINFLKGHVEFEYKIHDANKAMNNIVVYVIPMQENSHDKSGYIEVGTDKQNHPENEFSLFRQRIVLHEKIDNWKLARLEFDFSKTPTAFYAVFAPRINEGCTRAGKGEFSIKNIKIFKLVHQ